VKDTLLGGIRTVARWVVEFLESIVPTPTGSNSGSAFGWMTSSLLLYGLLALILAAVIIFFIRNRKKRKFTVDNVAAEAIQVGPDLSDENIRADQLPEDEWTKLAHSLIARGEFRLAMRSFYLASLSHLAQRNLIGVAKFKSNCDYENELRRRAHAIPDLLPVFKENVSTFERIWYGQHEADLELVQQFAANVSRIRMTS
jgi:hypothetical protein